MVRTYVRVSSNRIEETIIRIELAGECLHTTTMASSESQIGMPFRPL